MIKSWMSFLLPNDEYKRQKVVYFYAEAAGFSVILFLILFLINRLPNVHFDTEIILGLAIIIPLIYVTIRYILSGIEYADVVTMKQYKRQKKIFISQIFSFVIIFLILYTIFVGIPKAKDQWIEVTSLLISIGLGLFLVNYISLRRSFKKNKELIDEQ